MVGDRVSCLCNMEDEEVLSLVHQGDKEAQDYIIGKYKKIISNKAKSFFIKGADREDIMQEGMIGLYKSIWEFDKEKNVKFNVFASLCITRQMLTAIKMSTRQKHIPLNNSISLDRTLNLQDGEEQFFIDTLIELKAISPEEIIIDKEEKTYIETYINKTLSNLECKVLALYLKGISYIEIAKKLNKDEKSVDNALQRIRKKIENRKNIDR